MADLIDVHHHFLPDFYRNALLAAGQSAPDGIPGLPDWTESDAIQVLDRLGIRTAYLSISSPGVHFGDDGAARALSRRCNEEAARLVKAHPGRFAFFLVTPLPDVDGALAEIRYGYDELGASGVVFETNFQGEYLGDDRLAPIYQELDRRRGIIFLHPTSPNCHCSGSHSAGSQDISLGYPAPMIEFIFETTRTMLQMILSGTLHRYPNIRVIVPHAGAALSIVAGRVELLVKTHFKPSPDTPKDIRAVLRTLHYDLAGSPVPEQLGALLHIADPTRLHFGTDYCFTPPDVAAEMAQQLLNSGPINGQDLRTALTENSRALFAV